MSTINIDSIHVDNHRIARVINDLGELLMREDLKLYNDFIIENFEDLSKEIERQFLQKLYRSLLVKLEILKLE